MINDIIELTCPICGNNHAYKLTVNRVISLYYNGSHAPYYNREFTRIFTCPEKGGKFQAIFVLQESSDSIIRSIETEKAIGDHPDVLNNLAGRYAKEGQCAQAEPLFQRALTIREKVLGPDHPDVATSLNNLALLYYDQGQYSQAEPLFQRARAIWEKALSPDHRDMATSLNNFAALYDARGQYAQAEPLYQLALAIWEKAFDPDHPYVTKTLRKLAALYRAQGQNAKAETMEARAKATWK